MFHGGSGGEGYDGLGLFAIVVGDSGLCGVEGLDGCGHGIPLMLKSKGGWELRFVFFVFGETLGVRHQRRWREKRRGCGWRILMVGEKGT